MISPASDDMREVGLEFIMRVTTEAFRPAVYFKTPNRCL